VRLLKRFGCTNDTMINKHYETWVPLSPHRPGSLPSPTSGSDLVGGPHDLLKTFQKIPQTTYSITTSRLGVQDKTSVDFDRSR
jgi:hypothetical protein